VIWKEEQEEKEKENMATTTNNNNNNQFRLFAYLAVAIMSIAIIVGLFLVVQHITEDQTSQHVMENQMLIKNITTENNKLIASINKHEMEEVNKQNTHINISESNNEKLDKLLDLLLPSSSSSSASSHLSLNTSSAPGIKNNVRVLPSP